MTLEERTNVQSVKHEKTDSLSPSKQTFQENLQADQPGDDSDGDSSSGKENGPLKGNKNENNEEIPSGQPPTKKRKLNNSTSGSKTGTKSNDAEAKLREQVKEQAKRLKEEERLRKEMEKELKKRQKEDEKRQKEELKEQERKKKEQEREQERKKREEEKRKLQLEKEEEKKRKEREREEERKRKEQEKEEERKRKEQEREEEKKRKEQEREELKRQKEEEKKKKELKNQPSLAKFFTITPKKSNDSFSSTDTPLNKNNINNNNGNGSPMKHAELQEPASDYKSFFLSYHVRSDVQMASSTSNTSLQQGFDNSDDMTAWIKSHNVGQRGRRPRITVNEIVNMANESTIDTAQYLGDIPFKLLHFAEDVRPPYFGTFSKYECTNVALKPFSRISPDVNYDYDSEAEWAREDEEDGEDIGDEDSEDAMDDDDDDLDGFLDSDEEITKRQIIGPLIPTYKWNDGTDPETFTTFTIDVLLPVDGPIDPHFDYWKPIKPAKQAAKQQVKQQLKPTAAGQTVLTADGLASSTPLPNQPTNQQIKLLSEEALADLFEEMTGKFKNPQLLIELIKDKYPKFSRKVIKDTIKATAVQSGTTEKRWEVLDEYKKYCKQQAAN